MNVLNEKVVMLNKNWQACEEITVAKALSMLVAGVAQGMCVNSEHEYYPLHWEDWKKLPIREGDAAVHSLHFSIRAPRVIRVLKFDRVIPKEPKYNIDSIAERDGYKDYVTGEILCREDRSLDHVDPLGRGGKDEPTNVKLLHKKRNNQKGCRTPEEMNWKRPVCQPLRKRIPAELIKPTHPEHKLFLIVRE